MGSYGKGIIEVLVDKTMKELNVDFPNLSEGSHQKVYVKCTRCLEEFLRERRKLHQFHACPSYITRSDGLSLKWCNKCKSFLALTLFAKNSARYDGYGSWCMTCVTHSPGNLKLIHKHASIRKTNFRLWLKRSLSAKKKTCKKNGIECALTEEFLTNLWQSQEGKCYYTRVELTFGQTTLDSAWLERLDPTKGYTTANVVWASKGANCMKNDASPKQFEKFIDSIDFTAFIKTRLEYQLIHPLAKPLQNDRSTDAGHDIFSIEDKVLMPKESTAIQTGICVSCPEGFYITVEGRSGLYKKSIIPNRGIIDAGYVGEIVIFLLNMGSEPYNVKIGDRVAQLVIHRTVNVDLVKVPEFSPEYNLRGTAGFGSSGR